MPPVQQRYTPVPGFTRPESVHLAPSNSSFSAGSGSGGGYSDAETSNPYNPAAPPLNVSTPTMSEESPDSQQRNSSTYSDPFTSDRNRISTASIQDFNLPPSAYRHDSDASSRERELPPTPQRNSRNFGSYGAGLAAAGAGGVAAGAAAEGGGRYRDMPMSQVPGTGVTNQNRMSLAAYQNVPSESYWPAQPEGYQAATPRKSRKKLYWWIGGVLGVLAIAGIVAGVVISQVRNHNKSGASSGSDSTGGTGGGVISDPNDPSNFEKNPALHQSFWGFAYVPQGAQPPWCSSTQANVTRDIQLLSQLTTRLRLYGANCNSTALVLQAIQDTKVNMTIWPAIYVDSNEQAYNAQVTAITDALTTYGTQHIEGITVGNEYILNTAGTGSLTSTAYVTAAQNIMSRIKTFNATIQAMNLNKHLPIGTSDAGSLMSTTLAAGIDYFMANVHPWFGSVPIQQAAAWTWDFFQDFDVQVAAQAANNPATYIAETGWPTASMNASEENNGATGAQGDASVANLQTFLDTYVCAANRNGTQYFYFEAFDEPWKSQYGGVEPYWGLFDADRNLKNVTIPTC